MMYRPEGLEKWTRDTYDTVDGLGILPPQTTYPVVVPNSFEWSALRRRIFEAGADAMLKALKVQSEIVIEKGQRVTFPPSGDRSVKGSIVFIPEEIE